jgi:hypothetical protein
MTCSTAKTDVLNMQAVIAEIAKDKTVRVRRMNQFQVKKLECSIHKWESLSFDSYKMLL